MAPLCPQRHSAHAAMIFSPNVVFVAPRGSHRGQLQPGEGVRVDFGALVSVSDVPAYVAAERLGIGLTAFTSICRYFGITRWRDFRNRFLGPSEDLSLDYLLKPDDCTIPYPDDDPDVFRFVQWFADHKQSLSHRGVLIEIE
jgi:hypothetical protein